MKFNFDFLLKGEYEMKNKLNIAMTLAVVMAMLITTVALADYVVNNIDNTIDAFKESRTITTGGSTMVGFYVKPNNSDPNDVNGCNATGATPATVNFSVPANVTASATSLTFIGCDVIQDITFSSNIAGTYTIAVASVTGGKVGSAWSTEEAKFDLIVNASSDATAPVLHLPSNITTEATGPSGATVSFTATADDTNPAHPTVTCNPVSGSTFALGTTTVNCSATDAANNTANGSFTVTVQDTTAPTLSLPSNQQYEGNTTGGYNGAYTGATATDVVDASPTVVCTPASGSLLGLGANTINCTATDDSNNSSSGSFTVTVVDTTPPTLSLPSNQQYEGNTTGGYNGAYTGATATDIVDATPTIVCIPASGSLLGLGANTINCTATDDSNNSSSGSFTVTAVDTTPPTLSGMPSNMTVEGNTTGGANVSYTAPTASDIVDSSVTPSCSPASSSFFALGGPHTVTCTATDDSGNSASASFTVTVVDTTPPSLTCPANISGTVGQVVVLGSPTVSDIVDANPLVGNNAPASFGPGTTTVIWTATDASGNSAPCSQTVTLTYKFLGFFQPVDNLPTVNKAKAGQGIPFKWALQDANGNYISDLSTVLSYGYGSLACGGGTTDVIESYDTTGASGLRYDPIANQFIFTSKTDKLWAGSCKTFTLYLHDGTKHQANFNFVK